MTDAAAIRVGRAPAGSAGRLLLWAAFLVPLGYAGLILAVAVHEGLGHGGTALLLGGEFSGLTVRLDGRGYASASAPGSRVAVLAGGIVATTLLGFALLAACALVRRPLLRAASAGLAMTLLLDGLPYGFWNASSGRPPGDVGRILAAAGWPPLRGIFLVALGLLQVLAVVFGTRSLLGAVAQEAGPERRGVVVGVGIGTVVLTAIGSALFPWEEVTSTSSLKATLVGTALQAVVVLGLLRMREAALPHRPASARVWSVAILAAWLACAALVAAVLLRLERGWYWS